MRFLGIAFLLAFLTACASSSGHVVRTYYIAADEVMWNYAPAGMNETMGRPFNAYESVFTVRGPRRIGSVYRKVVYREYTDGTFRTLKLRPANEQYLGILGPVIHAEVGDTIKVVFKNNADRPFSIHPHGVFYAKDSEGSGYNDESGGASMRGGAVPPGVTHTYTWQVPERAGPGPNDPSSIVWLYHSHTDDQKDINSGLVGAIIVTRAGMAHPDGTPKDVDREFVALFQMFDENQSWYLHRNIAHFAHVVTRAERDEEIPIDENGDYSLTGMGFADSNFKFTINGYLYGNGPKMVMRRREHVRWYVVDMGNGINFHTPHWHGNTVLVNGQRTDVIALSPAQMVTADMVPDNPGTWLFHCHVSDHMRAGMSALYQVLP
jgi:manganese oxidase